MFLLPLTKSYVTSYVIRPPWRHGILYYIWHIPLGWCLRVDGSSSIVICSSLRDTLHVFSYLGLTWSNNMTYWWHVYVRILYDIDFPYQCVLNSTVDPTLTLGHSHIQAIITSLTCWLGITWSWVIRFCLWKYSRAVHKFFIGYTIDHPESRTRTRAILISLAMYIGSSIVL